MSKKCGFHRFRMLGGKVRIPGGGAGVRGTKPRRDLYSWGRQSWHVGLLYYEKKKMCTDEVQGESLCLSKTTASRGR